jgi:hypothetical protein
LEDTAKTIISQDEGLRDFSLKEVASFLGRHPKWVKENRTLFKCYTIPGRGPSGYELRFVRQSVVDYIERLRAGSNGNGNEHETVDQVINRVKAERAAQGQSL